MSAVSSSSLIFAYEHWLLQEEGELAQRVAANRFLDLWRKAPGPVKIWTVLRMVFKPRLG